MKKVDIFNEDNSIVIDDQYDTTDFTFHPESKKFDVSSSIKDDCFYNNQTIEYKIAVNPIEIHMRTLESSYEPPLTYSIKDGVVLKSDIIQKDKKSLGENYYEEGTLKSIAELEKQVEWSLISLLGHYEVNLYILSKHPEIISKEEYRRFLRQTVERLKLGVAKAQEAVKSDTHGLHFQTADYGNQIWYLADESEKKEREEYWKLPKEKQDASDYGKKIEYAQKFNDSLFNENSPKYVGVASYEFQHSNEIIDYIEKLLIKKDIIPERKAEVAPQQNNVNRNVGIIINLLTVFFIVLKLTDSIDWNWFAVISPFLIWQGLGFISGLARGVSK